MCLDVVLTKFFVFSSLIVFLCQSALAQPEVVELEEMSFYCPGCQRRSDGNCLIYGPSGSSVTEFASSELMPCKDAVILLLRRTVESVGSYPAPSADSLLSFVMRKRGTTQARLLAFKLLLHSSRGKRLVSHNASELLRIDAKAVRKLFYDLWRGQEVLQSKELWLKFWKLPLVSADFVELKGALSVVADKNALQELIAYLTINDIEADLKMLQGFEKGMKVTKSKYALELQRLIKCLKDGRFPDRLEHFVSGECSAKEFSIPLATYLRRAVTRRIIEAYQHKQLDEIAVLKSFVSLGVDKQLSPDTFKVVKQIASLNNLSPAKLRKEVPGLVGFLKGVHNGDPDIVAFIKMFEEMWSGLEDKPQEGSWSLVLLLIGGGCLLFVTAKIINNGKRVPSVDVFKKDQSEERSRLMKYFKLEESATLDDLKKAYYCRAKAMHPDSTRGNEDAFNRLKEKYERARALM